ncbi:STING domain-containing protein [Chitinophaga ginsengisoli]|uniref:CD-NTase-associated protein 12 n=1 Tax=Chitinophaga ginsengisoli TaxID=363837 RepID=A0A2P8GMB6_9BACT|nr:STING domain-containing protein [Chitinophaga ginsengisoli]PSL35086.1 putative nucleotide-binding protein with TIR-like domain [Chitinophaga ginsengisoli]
MKPYVVIFSSSGSLPVAEGIHAHLENDFIIHLWKGDFFGDNHTTPLWTFFKKLFHYDYAIIVLSNDNMVSYVTKDGAKINGPKDNVIFELGATMAKLGPQKTIILLPDEPQVKLPTYFDDVKPLVFTYHNQETYTDQERMDATASAAEGIRNILNNVTFDSFHSELPAQGLAHAYLNNFLLSLWKVKQPQELQINGKTLLWRPENGITVTVIMPDKIMGRQDADAFLTSQPGCYKTSFAADDGRNIGIYVLPRADEQAPLHILDIPTTLLTAQNIIGLIERFWREKDNEKVLETDNDFIDSLRSKEIVNFRRTLDHELALKAEKTYIISADEVPAHVDKLSAGIL